MGSQNNPGRQYNKLHALTLLAAVALAGNRFIGYDGNYATAAGGVHDCQGVNEHEAEAGEAVSVVTSYSCLVVAQGNIAFGDYVKPGADGKAVVGTLADHCGRALGVAADGQLVEVQIVKHIHA
jgi:hypothetical protein